MVQLFLFVCVYEFIFVVYESVNPFFTGTRPVKITNFMGKMPILSVKVSLLSIVAFFSLAKGVWNKASNDSWFTSMSAFELNSSHTVVVVVVIHVLYLCTYPPPTTLQN